MTTATSKHDAQPGTTTEKEKWLHAYRHMVSIRLFEEQVNEVYTRALMPGLAHLYSGEEAVAVGICEALRIDDYITSTHRGHGHCLAKGASPDRMFAELLGKEAGLLPGQRRIDAHCRSRNRQSRRQRDCRRQRGHRHRRGFCRQNSWYRSRSGLFLWRRRAGARIAVRSDEPGPIVEAAGNLRLRKQSYTTSTRIIRKPRLAPFSAEPPLLELKPPALMVRMCAPCMTLRATHQARPPGAGPAFLQCDTYRYSGHHVGDINREYYRSKQEEHLWKTDRDPDSVLGRWLIGEGYADSAALDRIASEVRIVMEDAVKFAIAAPYPNVDEVEKHVYA